jgi:hypothetical protein
MQAITKLITAELVIPKPLYTLGLAFDGERQIKACPAVAARSGRSHDAAGPLAEREPVSNSGVVVRQMSGRRIRA